jgi:DNA-binding response OmpR family regulator
MTKPIADYPIHLLETSESVGRSKRASVLVVEAEPSLAQFLVLEITRAGFSVRLATDGAQALRLMDQQIPDLLILASTLPAMDGLQVLCQVRNVIRQDVAVLTIALGNGEHEPVRALDLGADQVLIKPFGTRELLARVRELLWRTARSKHRLEEDTPSASELLRHGELLLNRPRQMATLSGERIPLSRSEFDLLATLVQHPGSCFSRAELQAIVRHECYVPGDRSLDHAVSRLRKKLGSYGGDLETVWGVGYRLRVR